MASQWLAHLVKQRSFIAGMQHFCHMLERLYFATHSYLSFDHTSNVIHNDMLILWMNIQETIIEDIGICLRKGPDPGFQVSVDPCDYLNHHL